MSPVRIRKFQTDCIPLSFLQSPYEYDFFKFNRQWPHRRATVLLLSTTNEVLSMIKQSILIRPKTGSNRRN